MSSSGIGGIFVVFGVLILLVVYLAIIYWYITIPAIALIIVYKKRNSIWKPKDETFLNDEVREHYKNGTMHDYYNEDSNSNQQYEGDWHEREEWVRQHFICYLNAKKGRPSHLKNMKKVKTQNILRA